MEKAIMLQLNSDDLRSIIKQELSSSIESLVQRLNENNQESQTLLTPEEASKMAKVSKTTLRSWEKNGIIEAHRIGRKVYYDKGILLASILKK